MNVSTRMGLRPGGLGAMRQRVYNQVMKHFSLHLNGKPVLIVEYFFRFILADLAAAVQGPGLGWSAGTAGQVPICTH